ncbi:MAG: 50S ribosomal protein L3 [Planctomycetota bacterium]|jgi:large subunit ribosomal protein L3
MTIGILGKKLGMTQLFQEDGTWVPVTVVQAGPCKVLQVKVAQASELPEESRTGTLNRGKKRGKAERPRRADGYYGVQLGFDEKSAKAATKAETGHAARSESKPQRFVRELRYPGLPMFKEGDEIRVGVLREIKEVDVTGISKGRGFAGTIKRHGFHRQAMSHGNSKSHRRQGGIGRQYTTAKGVPKGKKMPGHYGVACVTVQNLEVVKIDEDRNLLFLRGAVPGHRSGYVVVREAVKGG